MYFFRTIILFSSSFISAIPENGANPDDIAAAIETDILFSFISSIVVAQTGKFLSSYP